MRTSRLILLPVVFASIAVARVVATYEVYSPTFDEPAHLAAGMEWLDRGVYRYEPLHPPLGRIAIALGPWLGGFHSHGGLGPWQEGNTILHSRGAPGPAMALARAGILPFFVILVGLVGFWSASLGGPWAAAVAVLLLTLLPPVLAHAGLATTDVPGTTGLIAALFALVRWLERPSLQRGIALGGAVALALLCKMSAVVILPVACGAIWMLSSRGAKPTSAARLPSAALACAAAFLLLWAGYRFSVGPLKAGPEPAAGPGASAVASSLRQLALATARQPIYPAPEWARGLKQMLSANTEGRKNYVLGQPRRGGVWYFFPLALAVKTPLPFLVLALAGAVLLMRDSRRTGRWQSAAPVVAAAAILGVAMLGGINIGVRHVLAIYPLLAICGAAGVLALWRAQRRRLIARGIAAALVAWLAVESLLAHPDYLPYFNQLAGAHPERVLVDSDLDWGQDLHRLADTLRARKIDRIALAYHGKVNLAGYGLPPFTELPERTPTAGWIAISFYRLQLGYMGGDFEPFAWLRRHEPVARVGRSILLYHIVEPSLRSGTSQ